MSFFDEKVRFAQGSDTGENDAASTQPISGAEQVTDDVANRPLENLRKRTEVIRAAIETNNYFIDADRAFTLTAGGGFKVSADGSGYHSLVPDATSDLLVVPAGSPSQQSGGRDRGAKLFVAGQPYAGTLGVNDLALVASAQYTGQRGFADSTDLASGTGTSLGANDISFEIVADPGTAGGTASISVAATGAPKRHFKITYGSAAPGTTLNQLISYINNDASSLGSYGLKMVVRASTTSPGTSTSIPTFGPTILQGGYDAEAHGVTVAQLNAFFGTASNRLRDGEGLGLWFAGPLEASPGTGGRRQALYDLPVDRIGGSVSNVTPAVTANLFNTGREPEKIPGSILIGRRIGSEFVFADGTHVPAGLSYFIRLSESAATLGSLGASGGSALVGFAGSQLWKDSTGIAATTVQDAINEIVADLATTEGSARVGGAGMVNNATTGNAGTTIGSGAASFQLQALLDAVNLRVAETGHRLKGKAPIEKRMPEGSATGGAIFSRVVTNPSSSSSPTFNAAYPADFASVVLRPLVYDFGGGATLTAASTIDRAGSASAEVHLSSLTSTQRTALKNTTLAARVPNIVGDDALAIVVELTGVTAGGSGDGSGFYFLYDVNDSTGQVQLLRLDYGNANFTGAVLSSATIKFYQTYVTGQSPEGVYFTAFHADDPPLASVRVKDDTSKVVEVWSPDSTTGGQPAFRATAQDATWKVGQPNERSTDNILVTGDKSLLDGVETGTAANATASHHHGSDYTKTALYAIPVAATLPSTYGTDLVPISAPSAVSPVTTFNDLLPTGWVKQASIVRVDVDGFFKATPAGTAAAVEVRIVDPANAARVYARLVVNRPVVTTSSEGFSISQQVVVPVNGSRQFGIQLFNKASLDTTPGNESKVTVTEVGSISAHS